jgi:hypothetical protein
MRKRYWLTTALLAVGLTASLPAAAGITVKIGPPEAKVVVPPPPPKPGQVWVPGYWDYQGNDYVWVDGHWETERTGYRWRERRWVQRGDVWYSEGGTWEPADGPPPSPR